MKIAWWICVCVRQRENPAVSGISRVSAAIFRADAKNAVAHADRPAKENKKGTLIQYNIYTLFSISSQNVRVKSQNPNSQFAKIFQTL